MLNVEWMLPRRPTGSRRQRRPTTGGVTVPDLETAEHAFRAAVFAAAGDDLVEGHGLLCHQLGRDMAAAAELSIAVTGSWIWRQAGYTVVLTPTD